MIPYGKQDISKQDIDAVVEVLQSDFLTQGPKVPEFEKAVADYVGAQHAIAVNSATSALHIACLSLDIGKGDIVWTSPISFVASSNCALYCGAEIDFVDIDPETYNISSIAFQAKLTQAAKEKKLPKALIVVHLCGQSCDMEEIVPIAKHYGVRIIEDASHAIGAKYNDQPVGNCKYSDITIFSFHPVKIITTAEGGIAVTNSSVIADKIELLRSHGITKDLAKMTREPEGSWCYEQIALGFNYRMSDIQAALGLSQLKRLDEFVTKRHELASRYDKLLEDLPLLRPKQSEKAYSSYHLYIIRLKLSEINNSPNEVFELLREKGIGVNKHYIPIPSQPYYQQLGFTMEPYPQASKYYQEAITLPLFPSMTHEDQDSVIEALTDVLRGGK